MSVPWLDSWAEVATRMPPASPWRGTWKRPPAKSLGNCKNSLIHEPPCGVLVADKPCGPTSQDIVAQVRRFLKTKVGHTGTLDPLATGVLPLVVGRATRLAQFFQASDKEYEAELRLGQSTDTFDREGKTLEERPVPEISSPQAQVVLSQFKGEF